MTSQIISNLLNYVPNATAITGEMSPLIANVTSTAAEILSDLSYFQIGGMGLLMSAGGYLSYQFPYARNLYTQAQPILRGVTAKMDKIFILLAIREIPYEERETVIQRALPLIRDDMDPDHKVLILHAIQKIPSDEKNDVIQRASLLMTSDMSGIEKAYILEAIRKIPSEERDNVIQRALPLMRDHIARNFERSGILDAVRDISSGERDDVIQLALPLISHGMEENEDAKGSALRVIREIPAQERRDFVEQTLSLMQDEKGWDKIHLLEAVQKIPFKERRDIIEQTLLLLQSNTCRWNKYCTLNSVRNIPSEERADIIQLALSLVKNDDIAAYSSYFPLLEAIQKIPRAERNSKPIQILLYWHDKNLFDYRCLYGFVLNKKGNLHDFLHYSLSKEGYLNFMLPKMFSIISYSKTIKQFIESQKQILSPTEFTFLQNYSINIHRALYIFKECHPDISEEDKNRTAEKIYQEIQKLAPGELYSIASGWGNGGWGINYPHAVVYDIIREEQGFTLTIVNTGLDEINVRQRKSSTEPENDYAKSGRYPHKGYKIDDISTKLIKHLMPIYKVPGDKMLEHIDTACKELNGKEQNGRLHKFQLRSNCAQKCLSSSFKGECLRQMGPDAGNYLYERFRLYHSEKLEARIDEIERNVPIHEIMEIYKVTNEQELHLKIAERRQAVKEQINHRREKVRALALVN
ncbi:MAG TPA: hypothetical protein DCE71_04570 [Parachlamydiales bacterium]|nr:hypothetical protein [Parachlamydiales bacterium]